ncbi:Fanconi anemia group J protein homolog [Sphaerodactylus townsendi]|nr:Fanconi anemia group J protein homolog [Sphaerodactylus townsendi]
MGCVILSWGDKNLVGGNLKGIGRLAHVEPHRSRKAEPGGVSAAFRDGDSVEALLAELTSPDHKGLVDSYDRITFAELREYPTEGRCLLDHAPIQRTENAANGVPLDRADPADFVSLTLPRSDGLSKWIRQQIQHHESFERALGSLETFTKKNQKGTNSSLQDNSESLPSPSNWADPSTSSVLEVTLHLSPDVSIESGEQNLVPETLSAADVNTVHPETSSQSCNIFAEEKSDHPSYQTENQGHFTGSKSSSCNPGNKRDEASSHPFSASVKPQFSKMLTSTPVPVKSKKDTCQATPKPEGPIGEVCQLATNECQRELSLVEEGRRSDLMARPETMRGATVSLIQEYPSEPQLCASEDRRDVTVSPVRGNREPSALDITVETDAGDDSIYFTPELYDESAEEENEWLARASGDSGTLLELAESASSEDLLEVCTPNPGAATARMPTPAAAAETGYHGTMHSDVSHNSAPAHGASGGEAEREEGTPRRKSKLSRSRNKGVFSFQPSGC